MLGIIILFLGILLWQNREDRKQNTKLVAELVSNLKNAKQDNEKESKKEKIKDNKNIPEILANDYVVQNNQKLISDCFGNFWSDDHYENWPKSMKFNKNAPWSSVFLFVEDNYTYAERMKYNQLSLDSKSKPLDAKFIDLNGDGLLDYLYYNHQIVDYQYLINDIDNVRNSKYMSMKDCILLNNGQGFDVAYRCVTDTEWESSGNEAVDVYYHGDCADTST